MKSKTFSEYQKPKVHWMIIASWLTIIMGYCFLAISACLKQMHFVGAVGVYMALLFFLSSPFFSVIGLFRNHKLGGYWLGNFCGLTSLLLSILLLLYFIWPHNHNINVAKWSEGKAIMGTISTAIKLYAAETDNTAKEEYPQKLEELGFMTSDFDGTYFNQSTDNMFSFKIESFNPLKFTITATNSSLKPLQMILDQDGTWTEIDE